MSDIKKALDSIRERDKRIASLESQLAARNQAAEAMGVLERLVRETEDDGIAAVQMWKNSTGYRLSRTSKIINTEAHSLIEAVLKAGGENAQA